MPDLRIRIHILLACALATGCQAIAGTGAPERVMSGGAPVVTTAAGVALAPDAAASLAPPRRVALPLAHDGGIVYAVPPDAIADPARRAVAEALAAALGTALRAERLMRDAELLAATPTMAPYALLATETPEVHPEETPEVHPEETPEVHPEETPEVQGEEDHEEDHEQDPEDHEGGTPAETPSAAPTATSSPAAPTASPVVGPSPAGPGSSGSGSGGSGSAGPAPTSGPDGAIAAGAGGATPTGTGGAGSAAPPAPAIGSDLAAEALAAAAAAKAAWATLPAAERARVEAALAGREAHLRERLAEGLARKAGAFARQGGDVIAAAGDGGRDVTTRFALGAPEAAPTLAVTRRYDAAGTLVQAVQTLGGKLDRMAVQGVRARTVSPDGTVAVTTVLTIALPEGPCTVRWRRAITPDGALTATGTLARADGSRAALLGAGAEAGVETLTAELTGVAIALTADAAANEATAELEAGTAGRTTIRLDVEAADDDLARREGAQP